MISELKTYGILENWSQKGGRTPRSDCNYNLLQGLQTLSIIMQAVRTIQTVPSFLNVEYLTRKPNSQENWAQG